MATATKEKETTTDDATNVAAGGADADQSSDAFDLDAGQAAVKKFAAAELAERQKASGSDAADSNAQSDVETESEAETSEAEASTKKDDAADDDGAVEPTPAQVHLARQVGYTAEEISAGLTESDWKAIDRVARGQSRLQSRKGRKPDQGKKPAEAAKTGEGENATGAESSTGDDNAFFTDDMWGTAEGAQKMNELHQMYTEQQQQSQQQVNENESQTQTMLDAEFDKLDPEIFGDYMPGQSADIEVGSPADDRRTEVVVMATAIQNQMSDVGKKITMGVAIENALSIIAADEVQAVAAKTHSDAARRRGGQRINTPSASKNKTSRVFKTREEAAGAAAFAAVNSTD